MAAVDSAGASVPVNFGYDVVVKWVDAGLEWWAGGS